MCKHWICTICGKHEYRDVKSDKEIDFLPGWQPVRFLRFYESDKEDEERSGLLCDDCTELSLDELREKYKKLVIARRLTSRLLSIRNNTRQPWTGWEIMADDKSMLDACSAEGL